MEDYIIICAVIAVYFVIVIGVGYYFYHRSTTLSDYLLGGRTLNPYVTALSAQASDMSSWLLMGLPGAIYLAGMGQAWIGIGLAIGSYISWLVIAKRLRIYSEKAGNSLTLSEFFSNRFNDTKGYLRDISAVIILVFFVLYVASGFVGAANVFGFVLPQLDYTWAVVLGAAVIVLYTFLGGFKAVCWTDLLQGMLMVVAIVVVPVAAVATLGGWSDTAAILDNVASIPDHFMNLFYENGELIGAISIISSLAWGLGYFGMPHVIIRYTAIRDPKDLKISRRVATIWIVICLAAACLMAVIGRAFVESGHASLINGNAETIYIVMAGALFTTVIAAVIYSAILAAIMSTADSQLLVASSAVTNDLSKRFFKDKSVSDGTLMWISRLVVVFIAVIAAGIAIADISSIMGLVSYAWAGFGAAFGPLVILALFWKKSNWQGALAGMLVGFVTTIFWNTCMLSGGILGGGSLMIVDTGLYELVPAFILSLVANIVVSLKTGGPSPEIEQEYDEYQKLLEQ